jgi:hypothetical protein
MLLSTTTPLFLISSNPILQMANTRNCNANNNNNNNNNKNNKNEDNIARNPPPPLTLEQVLVMQGQMLQTMVNMQ